MCIMIDTREQAEHVKWHLEEKGKLFSVEKLDFGDYSYKIMPNDITGNDREKLFSNEIVVERKKSVDELATNLSTERQRLINEFTNAQRHNCIVHLMIEDIEAYQKILTGCYRSEYSPNAYTGSLHSFITRFNLRLMALDSRVSGAYVYNTCKYHLLEKLKNGEL